IFQGFCATLLFRLNPYQRAYFSNAAGDITARVNHVSSSVTHYFSLGEQNRILQSTIADSILHFNSNLQLHFLNDTFMVSDSSKRPWFDVIPAQVVYNSIHKSENYFVINKGSKDGINKGSGVISPQGVAGIVIAVGPRFSTAMSL